MQFDKTTAIVAICTTVAVFGVQFLFFWIRDRRSPWLAWYAAAYMFGAIAVPLYLIPPQGHEFLLYGAGNAVRILAFAFLWHGAREFAGRRPEQWAAVLAIAVWMAACSVPAFLHDMAWRMIASTGYVALFCGLGAFELWRNRDERLPSQGPLASAYASFALLSAARIPLVHLAPFPVGALPATAPWIAIFGLVAFVHFAFITALVPAMGRERSEREQRRSALTDPLTGMLNRRAFLDLVEDNGRHRKGGREPLSVLVLDFDHFKSINDRFGHEAGDLVLQHFGAVARSSTRATDLLYRMGGEEFCFVLPATRLAEARVVAERVRTRFADSTVITGGEKLSATVSIGIATAEHAGFDLDVLLGAADAAVYEAKARGRNQSVVADGSALRRPGPAGAQARVA